MSEWESWPFCKKCSLAAAAKFIVTMACGMSPEMFKMIAEMQQKQEEEKSGEGREAEKR
jgi:hypothetical protein